MIMADSGNGAARWPAGSVRLGEQTLRAVKKFQGVRNLPPPSYIVLLHSSVSRPVRTRTGTAKETVSGVSMALAHAIAEHLPYLRRYPRALCGTQKAAMPMSGHV